MRGLVSRDPLTRRRTLKAIGYRVPLRATIFTFYTMIVRLSLAWCANSSRSLTLIGFSRESTFDAIRDSGRRLAY